MWLVDSPRRKVAWLLRSTSLASRSRGFSSMHWCAQPNRPECCPPSPWCHPALKSPPATTAQCGFWRWFVVRILIIDLTYSSQVGYLFRFVLRNHASQRLHSPSDFNLPDLARCPKIPCCLGSGDTGACGSTGQYVPITMSLNPPIWNRVGPALNHLAGNQ